MKYLLVEDNDCHWYIIKMSDKKAWFAWVNSDNDNLPDFVVEEGVSPSGISFDNYSIDY
jgi:hypothetical protein